MNDKNLEKLFKGSEETFIVATKKGIGVSGRCIETLGLLGMLIQQLRENFGDKVVKNAIETGFKSPEEINKANEKAYGKENLEELRELLKKMLD